MDSSRTMDSCGVASVSQYLGMVLWELSHLALVFWSLGFWVWGAVRFFVNIWGRKAYTTLTKMLLEHFGMEVSSFPGFQPSLTPKEPTF